MPWSQHYREAVGAPGTPAESPLGSSDYSRLLCFLRPRLCRAWPHSCSPLSPAGLWPSTCLLMHTRVRAHSFMGKQHGVGNKSAALGGGRDLPTAFLALLLTISEPSLTLVSCESHEAQLQGLAHSSVVCTECPGRCEQVPLFSCPPNVSSPFFPHTFPHSRPSQLTDPRSGAPRTVLQAA